jgi:superfamily II DNA or RNA helicase
MQSKKLARLVRQELTAAEYRVGSITGDENEAQRNLYIEQFQKGELDVMICNAAGAEGITLTAGRSMIFVQHPESLIHYKQMLGRVPRIGNEADLVLCYHLISEGTVDEIVYNSVTNEKSARLEEIVRDQERLREALQ